MKNQQTLSNAEKAAAIVQALRITERRDGRELAGIAIEESIAAFDASPAFEEGFWREMRRLADEHCPQQTVPERVTMSEADALKFEQKTIGFGQHGDKTYGECPVSYLVWLVTQGEQLAAYMRSKPAQQRQGNE